MTDAPDPIRPGDRVRFTVMDGDRIYDRCGPGVVVAIDGPWPGEKEPVNRPAVWMRFTDPEGVYNYRSCDIRHVSRVMLQ